MRGEHPPSCTCVDCSRKRLAKVRRRNRFFSAGRLDFNQRQSWLWIGIILLSLILTAGSTGFTFSIIPWFLGFINYFSRILVYAIFIRAILSWFAVSPYNLFVSLLNDITEPILSPLRRMVPRFGLFDITPLIAIGILYLIPFIFRVILS